MAQTTKSFQETIKELWELLKAYAAQETVDPLKTLGRRVGFGIGGSLLFSFGWFLVTLGTVRLLQTHPLPLVHEWFMVHNWAIYGVAVAILGVGMFGALRKIRRPEPDLSAPARIERTA